MSNTLCSYELKTRRHSQYKPTFKLDLAQAEILNYSWVSSVEILDVHPSTALEMLAGRCIPIKLIRNKVI